LTLVFFARHLEDASAPRLQSWLRGLYEKVLGGVALRPWPVIGAVALFVVFALSRLPTLGGAFLPEFREGHFVLGVSAQPGTSLPEMMRIGKQISDALLKNPHIATVEQQVGRAELGEDTWGPHKSEFHVELRPLSGEEE